MIKSQSLFYWQKHKLFSGMEKVQQDDLYYLKEHH